MNGARRDREPGLRGRTESSMRRTIPLHRRPFAVATLVFRPSCPSHRILDFLLASWNSGSHTEFFTVIQLGRGLGCQEQCGHELRNLIVMDSISVAVPRARLVVVAEKEIGLALQRIKFDFIEQLTESKSREFVHIGNLKIHRKLYFIPV